MKATARKLGQAAGGGMRYGPALRSAVLDIIAVIVGAEGTMEIRTGLPAFDLRTAAGQLLAVMPLPEPWLGRAADGVARLVAPLAGVALAAGVAGHFRILDAAGNCCLAARIQFDAALTAGDPLLINQLDITAGNA